MKKRTLKALVVSTIAATAVGVGAPAAAEKWDMPMAYSDSNFHTQNGKAFAEAVNVAVNVAGAAVNVAGSELRTPMQQLAHAAGAGEGEDAREDPRAGGGAAEG